MIRKLLKPILIICGVILLNVNVVYSQNTIGTNVGGAVEDRESETVENFTLSVGGNVEEALFYDTFTTSEYMRINKKISLIDVVYVVGYATSKISLDTAKDLALKSANFINKLENITNDETLRLNIQSKKFYFYDKKGELVYGCLSYAKLIEYNTTPMKYVENSIIGRMFYIIKKGIKELLGFGRLLKSLTYLGY